MSLATSPLLIPLHLVPDAARTFVLARALNHFLRGQSLAGRLQELNGRSITVDVSDANWRFRFLIRNGRLNPVSTRRTDVVIRGSLRDFWLLATRREDPDTLFFNRRLCIEGDTETGVHIKNLLDALEFDWDTHFHAVLPAPLAGPATHMFHRLHRLADGLRGKTP